MLSTRKKYIACLLIVTMFTHAPRVYSACCNCDREVLEVAAATTAVQITENNIKLKIEEIGRLQKAVVDAEDAYRRAVEAVHAAQDGVTSAEHYLEFCLWMVATSALTAKAAYDAAQACRGTPEYPAACLMAALLAAAAAGCVYAAAQATEALIIANADLVRAQNDEAQAANALLQAEGALAQAKIDLSTLQGQLAAQRLWLQQAEAALVACRARCN